MTKCKMGLVCDGLHNCRKEKLCYEKPMDHTGHNRESAYKRCMLEQCSFCADEASVPKASVPKASVSQVISPDCSNVCRYVEQLECGGGSEQERTVCESVQEPKLVCKDTIRVPAEMLSEAIADAAAKAKKS